MSWFDSLPDPVVVHSSLTDPSGPPHLGDEFDCPDCRTALLQAFKLPPGVSEEDVLHRLAPSPLPPEWREPSPTHIPVPGDPDDPTTWTRPGCLFCPHQDHPIHFCPYCACGHQPPPLYHEPGRRLPQPRNCPVCSHGPHSELGCRTVEGPCTCTHGPLVRWTSMAKNDHQVLFAADRDGYWRGKCSCSSQARGQAVNKGAAAEVAVRWAMAHLRGTEER